MTTCCSFAAVGRKKSRVLCLHFESCHICIYVALFSLELTIRNIFGVFCVLSFFLSLTDPFCAFFPHNLTQCMWPNQLPHFSSQSPQAQLWKWPFSHLRGTDADLRVRTFVDTRFKLPRTKSVILPQNMD